MCAHVRSCLGCQRMKMKSSSLVLFSLVIFAFSSLLPIPVFASIRGQLLVRIRLVHLMKPSMHHASRVFSESYLSLVSNFDGVSHTLCPLLRVYIWVECPHVFFPATRVHQSDSQVQLKGFLAYKIFLFFTCSALCCAKIKWPGFKHLIYLLTAALKCHTAHRWGVNTERWYFQWNIKAIVT